MRTASNRLNLNDVGDFIGPREVARILGIAEARAYQLVRSQGFPAKQIGRRWIINKQAFIDWWNREAK
ncbi:DNA binding domain-containing protein, excisionase family [Desulfofundulus australicus DSM 11792]|uniref:DNA-binding protein n=2 Tax=Desulfofundulus TaxID=2282741 RepID=A0A494X1H9_9FIRM|nr:MULTISPECIES: helix-turn-helix domain-containing protein [Desulfofundulus]RKO67047.1 DNA-binding protein [Desulfofundulus salinum]SHF68775.1 DNA binding domain-containing protein, excisionase family [Desulfofundulus australicus DSM 11792]